MATFWIKKIENGFKIAILEELRSSFEEHMNKYIPFFDAELKNDEQNNLKKELDSIEWMKFLVNKGIVEVNKNTSSKFTPRRPGAPPRIAQDYAGTQAGAQFEALAATQNRSGVCGGAGGGADRGARRDPESLRSMRREPRTTVVRPQNRSGVCGADRG